MLSISYYLICGLLDRGDEWLYHAEKMTHKSLEFLVLRSNLDSRAGLISIRWATQLSPELHDAAS